MESDKSLFTLDIDATGKSHLKDAAKWARFLAIVGFVALALILIFSIIVALTTQRNISREFDDAAANSGAIFGTILGAVVVIAIYFFPCYFLLKFANKMRAAIDADDTSSLNESFKNLKVMFRYVGVITIIFVVLFAISLLANLTNT